jgi:hypothetical protein
MISALSAFLTAVTLLAAAWALVKVARDKPLDLDARSDRVLLGVLGVAEAALLIQAVAGFVLLAITERDVSSLTFGGYLLGLPLILPIAAWWALGDRTRAGAGVLIVGLLTVPAMILRMHQVWAGHA